MPGISTKTIRKHFANVFRECLHGPAEEFAYFSNPGPSLVEVLDGIDASAASREIGGSSIASQVRHLEFSFRVFAAWLRGEAQRPDWKESWVAPVSDEAAWDTLRTNLREAFVEAESAIGKHTLDTEKSLAIALGAVAHTGYHLGTIRQKLRLLKEAA